MSGQQGSGVGSQGPGTPASGPSLAVAIQPASVTVGDPVTVTVYARVPTGAVLIDRMPRAVDTLSTGTRVLASDSLREVRPGELVAHVRLAFFRPEPQHLPPFAVAYRAVGQQHADTLVSAPVAVAVVPVVPDAGGTLRDIKDIEASPVSARLVGLVLTCVVLAIAAVTLVARRRRRKPVAVVGAGLRPVRIAALTPYEVALQHLAEIEHGGRTGHSDVARHFARTADVVREYLERAFDVPAMERTTPELFWALPPALAAHGARDAVRAFLDDADLVKFARERPDHLAASAYLEVARRLIEQWHVLERDGTGEHTNGVAPTIDGADAFR